MERENPISYEVWYRGMGMGSGYVVRSEGRNIAQSMTFDSVVFSIFDDLSKQEKPKKIEIATNLNLINGNEGMALEKIVEVYNRMVDLIRKNI